MISAFDYARFCKTHLDEQNRLLFVANREEILEQSIETFRGVLHDLNFGDLWVGSHKPEALDHLFVSIQTLNLTKFYQNLPKDYYDFIVVDEFHHAAAAIYQEPLRTFAPKILLGLTATPERMDGGYPTVLRRSSLFSLLVTSLTLYIYSYFGPALCKQTEISMFSFASIL